MELIRREVRAPVEHTTTLARRYDNLITAKAETEIDELVARSPSFDEYGHELRRYAAVLDEINYNSVKVVRLGTFEVLPFSQQTSQTNKRLGCR